jgi:hypothetical protein
VNTTQHSDVTGDLGALQRLPEPDTDGGDVLDPTCATTGVHPGPDENGAGRADDSAGDAPDEPADGPDHGKPDRSGTD